MKWFLLSVVLLVGVRLYGQGTQGSDGEQGAVVLPDSPSSTNRKPEEDATAGAVRLRSLGGLATALSFQSAPFQKRPHVVNRAFALFALYQFAAGIADLETTERGFARGDSEGNPLIGSHPSRATLYEIALPVSLGIALWSYSLKKKGPHSRNWMIPPSVYGCGHI